MRRLAAAWIGIALASFAPGGAGSGGGWSLAALAGPGAAWAADLTVQAAVDQGVIGLDGQILLTVTVQGALQRIPDPLLPSLEDAFAVRSAGTSRNFSFVNGKMSSSSEFRFLLSPRKPGKFTIGPVEVRSGKDVYRSEPIQVEVTRTSAPSRTLQEEKGIQGGGKRGEVFITTSVDRKEAYVNEQVTLTFRFYQKVQLLESPSYTPPPTTGFWSEDLPPQRNFYQLVNGERFYVTEIKTALFPTSPGSATIGAARLEAVVESRSAWDPDDPFSLFGVGRVGGRRVALQSDPLTIAVKPLPPGAPAGFGGAVGAFKISVRVDRTETNQTEPVTVTIAVSGTGNVKQLRDPEIPPLPGFKVFDSSGSSDLTKTGYTVAGTRTVQKVLVPERAGELEVPAIRYVYFDPKKGAYETTTTDPVRIRVAGGGLTSSLGGSKQGIRAVGKDIRYIRTDLPRLRAMGSPIYLRPWFLGLQALAPLGTLAAFAVRRRRERLRGDVGYARRLRSAREASKRLKAARSAARHSKTSEVYGAIAGAVTGYLGDRLNLSPHGVTVPEWKSRLAEAGAPAEVAARIETLLDRADFARFAPGADSKASVEGDLREAEKILAELERKWA